MSYFEWAPYVPVATRRAQAQKQVAKLKKQGKDIQPVVIEGRRLIAKTFWGKGWCDHLEQFSDYANRLPRGRTYARNGSVCHLGIKKGEIEAIVSGSELYHIRIKITPLTKQKWQKIQQQCSEQIGSVLELLQGKLSDSIMDIVTHPEEGLFPLPSEINMHCDCPDWADLCKHLAAVLYGIGARLDEHPELLFTLRGVDHTQLISDVKIPVEQSKRRKIKGDIGDVFGIELDQTVQKSTKKSGKIAKKKVKKSLDKVKSENRKTVKSKTAIKKKSLKKVAKKKAASKKVIAQKTLKTKSKSVDSPVTVRKRAIRPTGKTIIRLRTYFGMNYSQFATLVGVSSVTIKNWETKTERLQLKPQSITALAAVVDLDKEQAWEKLESKH